MYSGKGVPNERKLGRQEVQLRLITAIWEFYTYSIIKLAKLDNIMLKFRTKPLGRSHVGADGWLQSLAR